VSEAIESEGMTPGREEVLTRVRQIVTEKEGVEAVSVRAESALEADLGMDSLSKVELQMALEEAYDVVIEDSATASVTTVGDVVDGVLAALRDRVGPPASL
jgi:acyl carrier protein